MGIHFSKEKLYALTNLLKSHHAITLRDLQDERGQGQIIVVSFRGSIRATRWRDNPNLISLLAQVNKLESIMEDGHVQKSNGWQWRIGEKDTPRWPLSNSQWRNVIRCPTIYFSQCNKRWKVNFKCKEQKNLWKQIWVSMTFHKDRVFIWRPTTQP